jgi:RNase adapter protein RapZ
MQLLLITGLSGSGKSVALNVLEDAGYFCVDNLPAPLLPQLVGQLKSEGHEHVAVAMDMRGGPSLAALPKQLRDIEATGSVTPRLIFLDASDEILIQRFSETRRSHPLADDDTTLAEAISREREAVDMLSALGHQIDTSYLSPNALRTFIKDFAAIKSGSGFTLLFESFGFKHGLPRDADIVFDVRCLPNPHYDPQLRPLTGHDPLVAAFLHSQPEVMKMAEDIRRFTADWLPAYVRDNRAYLTIAIGCTGGQHRSVFLAEWLAKNFIAYFTAQSADSTRVLVRHRTLAQ